MELRELNTLTYPLLDGIVPFCMSSSDNGQQFCITARQSAHISHLHVSYTSNGIQRLQQSTISPLQTMPTKNIPVCAKTIYNTAKDKDKQQLCLDALLIPDLAPIQHKICFISVHWSPTGSVRKRDVYAACLTNYGGCEIIYKSLSDRKWRSIVANISDIWSKYCHVGENTIMKFETLQRTVHDIHLTAICWNNIHINNSCLFACISASGKFIVYNIENFDETINSNHQVNLQIVQDLQLYKVNILRWFSVYNQNNQLCSFLIAGDLHGNAILYAVSIENGIVTAVSRKINLWYENDKLIVGDIIAEYQFDINYLLVVLCKGSHCLVFLIDVVNEKLVNTATHYVGNLFITGLCQIAPLKYVVCTLAGTLQYLTITVINTELKISADNIKTNINFVNYALYGISVSKNQALWFLAIFPRQSTDHLVMRQPVTISICSFSTMFALDIIRKNNSYKMQDYYDCLVMLSLSHLKYGDITDDFQQQIFEDIEITDEYLYKLRIHLFMCIPKAEYLRRKSQLSDANLVDIEFVIVKETILALTYYKFLKSLLELGNTNDLSNFQKLSVKYFVAYIKKYFEIQLLESYQIVRDTLKVKLLALLDQTNIIESAPELCVYCNDCIEPNKFTCKDHHEMSRCCITMVQVPIINFRWCNQCQAVALDNIEDLQKITLRKSKGIFCPICDVPLETHYAAFDTIELT